MTLVPPNKDLLTWRKMRGTVSWYDNTVDPAKR